MTEPNPPLRQRLRNAAAEAMRDAAEAVMIEKGFEKATMQGIATAAGCAVGTLYLHYKTKNDLFTAIIRKHGATLLQAVHEASRSDAPPLDKLKAVITAHLKWGYENAGFANLACSTLPLRYYEFQNTLAQMIPVEHATFHQIILAIIQQAQAAGQIRTDFPAEALADLVLGLLLTVLDQFAARPKAYTLEQQVLLTWGFITSGLAPKGVAR